MIPDETKDLPDILASLKKGFHTGKTRDLEIRLGQLRSLRNGIAEMSDELCKAIQMDLGRGPFYAYVSEVHLVLSELDNAIDNFHEWAKTRSEDTPFIVGPGSSYVRPEPLGVVLVMNAWNYPIYTMFGPASQIIAAGNCMLLKPSEVGPNCCKVLYKLCEKYLDS